MLDSFAICLLVFHYQEARSHLSALPSPFSVPLSEGAVAPSWLSRPLSGWRNSVYNSFLTHMKPTLLSSSPPAVDFRKEVD